MTPNTVNLLFSRAVVRGSWYLMLK
jgi:hypothetical protein